MKLKFDGYVVKSYTQIDELNYLDTFAPIAKLVIICFVLSIDVICNLHLDQFDVNAFQMVISTMIISCSMFYCPSGLHFLGQKTYLFICSRSPLFSFMFRFINSLKLFLVKFQKNDL